MTDKGEPPRGQDKRGPAVAHPGGRHVGRGQQAHRRGRRQHAHRGPRRQPPGQRGPLVH